MEVIKYRITAAKAPGYMMVIYQDNHFKSVLNEFKPPLNQPQLNAILRYIPNDPSQLQSIFKEAWPGKITVELIKPIGAEPALQPATSEGAKAFPINEKIAMWCNFYGDTHKDEVGAAIKYKAGAAEVGKLKALFISQDELLLLFKAYFASDLWWSTPKSISNFINKYNEVRALVYSKPKEKTYPLPYDEQVYAGLDFMGKKGYHAYLKENGYRFELNAGRGGKWVNY